MPDQLKNELLFLDMCYVYPEMSRWKPEAFNDRGAPDFSVHFRKMASPSINITFFYVPSKTKITINADPSDVPTILRVDGFNPLQVISVYDMIVDYKSPCGITELSFWAGLSKQGGGIEATAIDHLKAGRMRLEDPHYFDGMLVSEVLEELKQRMGEQPKPIDYKRRAEDLEHVARYLMMQPGVMTTAGVDIEKSAFVPGLIGSICRVILGKDETWDRQMVGLTLEEKESPNGA